jgi:hypothetical protein
MFSEQSLEFLLIGFLPVMSFLICNVTFHRVQINALTLNAPYPCCQLNSIPCSFIHLAELHLTTETASASTSTGGNWISRCMWSAMPPLASTRNPWFPSIIAKPQEQKLTAA